MEELKGLECVHAYNGLRVANGGYVTPCCYYNEADALLDEDGNVIKTDTHTFKQMMDSPSRLDLIDKLENGIQHKSCERCWADEKITGQSKRMRDTKSWKRTKEREVKYIELNLGNTCNLACRMCGVGASINWMDEHRAVYDVGTGWRDDKLYKKEVRNLYKSYEDESLFWNELYKELPTIETIDMYGGEPMLMKKQWEVLKKSVELGYAKNQQLHFNTNGTIYNETYIDILRGFKKVVLSFSIDAIGDKFDYIRHRAHWNDVETKVRTWIDLKKEWPELEIDICATVTNLNIYWIDEVVSFANEVEVPIYFINVSFPDFYTPYTLPTKHKINVTEKLNKFMESGVCMDYQKLYIKSALEYMNETDNHISTWRKFVKATGYLDGTRKQSYLDVFPEMKEYVNFEMV